MTYVNRLSYITEASFRDSIQKRSKTHAVSSSRASLLVVLGLHEANHIPAAAVGRQVEQEHQSSQAGGINQGKEREDVVQRQTQDAGARSPQSLCIAHHVLEHHEDVHIVTGIELPQLLGR